MVRRQRRETQRERQRREAEEEQVRHLEQVIQQRDVLSRIETSRYTLKMASFAYSYGMGSGQFMKNMSAEMLEEWKRSYPALSRVFDKKAPDPGPSPVLIETDYSELELRVLAYAKGDAEFTSQLFKAVYPEGLDEPPQEDPAQEEPAALDRSNTNREDQGLGASH